jgi:hypothetical protein
MEMLAPDSAPSRYVIEAAPGTEQDAVEAMVATALGFEGTAAAQAAGVHVEPLFEWPESGDPAFQLERYFTLTLPGDAPTQAGRFDLAYELRERGGFARVDPDVEISLIVPADAAETTPGIAFELGRTDPTESEQAWSLKQMHIPEAWAMPPEPGGKALGQGVFIGHPDTGWAPHDHINLDAYDFERAIDLLDPDNNAQDPLHPELIGMLRFPGHGTATSSVAVTLKTQTPTPAPTPDEPTGCLAKLVPFMPRFLYRMLFKQPSPQPETAPGTGSDEEALDLCGVAPGAKIIPVRFTDTVIIVSGINLARAINYAASQGVGVISMSVGGVATGCLEKAVQHAVYEHNCIVIAAAGQPWWMMGFPAPAFYDDTIAVAATTVDETPWAYSERGPSVTVCAPGANVWRAGFELKDGQMEQCFEPSNGTSYSAAAVAGVAALWLAHHGEQRLKVYKDHGIPLHYVFKALLTETAHFPKDEEGKDKWSAWQRENYGAGIVDAKALLEATLPPPEDIARPARQRTPAVELLARMAQGLAAEDGPETAAQLARASIEAALETKIEDFEAVAEAFDAELMYLLVEQRDQAQAVVPATRDEALSFAAAQAKPAVSRRLREAVTIFLRK